MGRIRTRIAAVCCALALGMVFGHAAAQDESQYPSKAIKIVVPLAAGGAVDIAARLVGDGLSRAWRQPVIIDDKPGAQGSIAASLVAKSPNDGYTLLMGVSSISINPLFYSKLPYDPVRDFIPVAQVVDAPYVLLANREMPFQSVSELVQWAKRNPGKLNFGSFGQTTYLGAVLLNVVAGIDMVHVPYKGGAQSQLALMTGEVSVAVDPSALELIKGGKLKALAVMSVRRSMNLPEVPTIVEAGYADLVLPPGPNGIFAPAGTPKPIVDKISREVNRIVLDPAVRKKIMDMGQEPAPGNASPEQYRATLDQMVKTWSEIVRKVGFKPE
jgi:tripartite-type tricarboxylate transporter receptor subunit TctC